MIPPAPAPAPPASLVAYGPTGSAGTVLCGGVVARALPRGRWLGAVHARLQVPQTYGPIVPGQVLLMLEVRAASAASRAVTAGDTSFAGRGVYAVRGYVYAGGGLVVYPNVWVGQEDLLSLEASVWSLDNLSYRAVVDIVYTMSDEPIVGADSVERCDNPDSWAPIVLQSSDPAADTEVTVTVGVGLQLRLDGARGILVTDANVASREVELRVTRASVIIARAPPVTTQPASTTRDHNWYRGMGVGNTNLGSLHAMPLWDMILNNGDVVATNTGGRQVTDNWGAMVFHGRYRVIPGVPDPA